MIAADRYREAELRDALDGVLPGSVQLVLRGQGWKDGGEDVRRFERCVLEERVKAPKSLLIRSSLAESRTITDPTGSTKLAVGAQGGRRAAGRDDVSAAIILALAEADRRWPQGIVQTAAACPAAPGGLTGAAARPSTLAHLGATPPPPPGRLRPPLPALRGRSAA